VIRARAALTKGEANSEFPFRTAGLAVDTLERRNQHVDEAHDHHRRARCGSRRPALAMNNGNASRTRAIQELQQSPARASVDRLFDADARTPYNTPPQFAGYPTDYLMNRFGDRQIQGR
jgi:hypothetical protein